MGNSLAARSSSASVEAADIVSRVGASEAKVVAAAIDVAFKDKGAGRS